MAVEIDETPLKYQFLENLQSGDLQVLHAFLDKQNISDVAELINEFPEQ
jgi:vacuolar-type H+-ATPase subunit C/Vma6